MHPKTRRILALGATTGAAALAATPAATATAATPPPAVMHAQTASDNHVPAGSNGDSTCCHG